MSKKNIILLISIFLIIFAGTIAGYFLLNPKETKVPQAANLKNNLRLAPVTPTPDLGYEDSSGFSFKYPKSFKVSDITPDDEITYSFLQLTKDGESITIGVTDTAFKGVEDLVATKYKGATLVGATSLAGVSANQYSFNGNLITLAIDQGVLYEISGVSDNGFLEETQGIITSSFVFADQKSAQAAGSGDAGTIYEEEEVVE